MGWSIENIVNTVTVSKKCISDLFKAQAYEGEVWYEEEDVAYKNKLSFNADHAEHMDYLDNNPAFTKILCNHKVKGDICFGSLEGDNAGSFWGYRFNGKGQLQKLEGTLVWTPQG